MNLQRQRFRLGLFVIGGGMLLAAMAVFFGGTPRMFLSRVRYTILFEDAPGVVRGTPVRKSGVRIGEVEGVELDDKTGWVRVRIAIDPQFKLRTCDEPVIAPDLLSRDTTIDFVPLTPPRQPPKLQSRGDGITPVLFSQAKNDPEPPLGQVIPPGSEIKGRTPIDARTLLREAQDVIPTVQQSLNQIRKTVERLGNISEESIREYTELAKSIRESVPELRRTNDEARAVLKNINDLNPDIRQTLGDVRLLAKNASSITERFDVALRENPDAIKRTVERLPVIANRIADLLNDENQRNFASSLKSLQGLAKNLDELSVQARTKTLPKFEDSLGKMDSVLLNVNAAIKPFADSSDKLVRNIDSSVEQIAKLIGQFSCVFGQVANSDGSVQRLFHDPSLFNNLNDASLMLARILPRADRILKDFEVFADKIARHPESLGVGGAVRPSAGLKDPPNAPITNYKPRQ